MIAVRKSEDRGHLNHGWLDAKHSFSFGRYYDPRNMGFRALRVINEDRVKPGHGFGEHPHDNMEIVTYVLSGTLAHSDSLGHVQTLRHGEVQRMSAGTGIEHAEFNHSKTEPVHLLQIWLHPANMNTAPSYEQKAFDVQTTPNEMKVIVSPDGENGSLKIGRDVKIYAGVLESGRSARVSLKPGRHAWVQVAAGAVALNGTSLKQGDGAAVSDERELELASESGAEVLVFDLD